MRVRFNSTYLFLPLVLLAIVEGATATLAAQIFSYSQGRLIDHLANEILVGIGYVLAGAALGLFSSRQRARADGLALRVVLATATAVTAVGLLSYIGPQSGLRLTELAGWFGSAVVLVGAVRIGLTWLFGDSALRRRVLVYGAGRQAASLSRLRRRSDLRGFSIIGYILAEAESPAVPEDRVLDVRSHQIKAVAQQHRVDEIVVAMDDRRRQFPVRELLLCRLAGIEVTDLVSFLERETGTVRLDVLNPSWIIFSEGFRRDPVRQFTKRLFDVLTALLLLAVAWPLMAITVLAIKLEDGLGAPVLYRQRRVGFEEKTFEVLKFRSMRIDAEKDGRPQWAKAGDSRVTRVGSLIRRLRVDELPQVLNVLAGDMSFVGPRPERPEFVAALGDTIPYFNERHFVKPGITGWAQICYPYGASEKDAAEKLQYDLYYVKHHTLLFDLVILLQTVEVVLFRKGGR